MPYKDKEKHNECWRRYYQRNREKILEKNKEYNKKNKEKTKGYMQKCRNKNKEEKKRKHNEYSKKYYQRNRGKENCISFLGVHLYKNTIPNNILECILLYKKITKYLKEVKNVTY
jgi:hypothetical protein